MRAFNKDELNKILEQHALWLSSEGADGKRTNFLEKVEAFIRLHIKS